MGIVVTVFMLLGLLLVSPLPVLNLKKYKGNVSFVRFVGFGLLLMGLWNLLWFGLRHLQLFWGQAAVVSGLFMIVVAILILGEQSFQNNKIYIKFKVLSVFFIVGLFLSFLLYAVTLIQLNLGYGIIS